MRKQEFKVHVKQLSVRLPEDEYDAYYRMCRLDLKSMAEVTCELIRKHMEKHKKNKG
jgi:hypothetical protein